MSSFYTATDKVGFGVEGDGVYLFSGTPNGSSGYRFGSLAQGATVGEPSALGYFGEARLSLKTFGMMFGTSPQGFPLHTLRDLRLGYRVSQHAYFETLVIAHNARNYTYQAAGFSLQFLIRRLPTDTDLHPNSIATGKLTRHSESNRVGAALTKMASAGKF